MSGVLLQIEYWHGRHRLGQTCSMLLTSYRHWHAAAAVGLRTPCLTRRMESWWQQDLRMILCSDLSRGSSWCAQIFFQTTLGRLENTTATGLSCPQVTGCLV